MKNVGSLISEILTWLTNMGYAGIAIGLMIEIIPSEIVLAYGGYMVSEGTIGFIGAIIAGVIGECHCPDLYLLDRPLWRQAISGQIREVFID